VRIVKTSRRDKGLATAGFIAAADHSTRYRITLPNPVSTLKMKVTIFQIYDLGMNEY